MVHREQNVHLCAARARGRIRPRDQRTVQRVQQVAVLQLLDRRDFALCGSQLLLRYRPDALQREGGVLRIVEVARKVDEGVAALAQ